MKNLVQLWSFEVYPVNASLKMHYRMRLLNYAIQKEYSVMCDDTFNVKIAHVPSNNYFVVIV